MDPVRVNVNCLEYYIIFLHVYFKGVSDIQVSKLRNYTLVAELFIFNLKFSFFLLIGALSIVLVVHT